MYIFIVYCLNLIIRSLNVLMKNLFINLSTYTRLVLMQPFDLLIKKNKILHTGLYSTTITYYRDDKLNRIIYPAIYFVYLNI